MGRKIVNTADLDMIVKRREMVSALRLKGMSLRQITEALARGDRDGNGRMVNPNSGEPFDVSTIHADLEYLKAEWAANAARSTDEFIAEDLAELIELKRAAWSKGKYDIVLRIQERRAKLLGLDKPTQVDLKSNGNELKSWTAERFNELDKLAESQLGNWKEVRGGSTGTTDGNAK